MLQDYFYWVVRIFGGFQIMGLYLRPDSRGWKERSWGIRARQPHRTGKNKVVAQARVECHVWESLTETLELFFSPFSLV